MPVATAVKRRAKREKTKADYEAFRSAAGGWKEVDTDQLRADMYADRAPPVVLKQVHTSYKHQELATFDNVTAATPVHYCMPPPLVG